MPSRWVERRPNRVQEAIVRTRTGVAVDSAVGRSDSDLG